MQESGYRGLPIWAGQGILDSMVGELQAFFSNIGCPVVFSPDDSRGSPYASSAVTGWLKATSLSSPCRDHATPAPWIFSCRLHLRSRSPSTLGERLFFAFTAGTFRPFKRHCFFLFNGMLSVARVIWDVQLEARSLASIVALFF